MDMGLSADEDAMSVLRVENLRKSYGRLHVTRDINLAIEPGERHVIIGPNGAGKTTLIHQIGGQLSSDSGTILIDGKDVTRLPPEARARAGVGRTFQKNTLFSPLSVYENVRLGVQARYGSAFDVFTPARSVREIESRAAAIIDVTGLRALAERPLSSLSYGDQRHMEVAAALAGDPRLLLLDEPTSGLSPAETRLMIELIKSLPRNMAIVMIEHDMEVVFSIADRITVLYYGAVLASGEPRAVAADPKVREVYLGASISHA
jgi:branched-chain amino acid transport system ATP-binding protein